MSGPVGGEVLVVADAGDATALSTITAATGAQELLFETQFIVPAATLSPEGDEIWYVKIDRTSGGDLGLWRRPRAGEVETQVLREPLGEPFDPTGLSVWQVMISPDGEHVAAQWCFGEVRCATHVVHVASGRVQSTDDLGWARGFTESQLVTAGVEADHQGVRAVDLSTFQETAWFRAGFEDGVTVNADGGWWLVGSLGAGAPTRLLRLLPGAEPVEVPGPENDFTTFHRPYDAGVGPLPGGWVLRYPEVIGTWPGEGQFASGQLINISTGERLELQPFLPEITADECPIVAPSQTPAGLASGSSRSELRDGVRYVRWSQGPDAVTLAMGALGLSADEPVVAETTVRGNPATVAVLGEPGVDEVAIVWEEDGCTYTALLAPGTTVESAIEYAGRY